MDYNVIIIVSFLHVVDVLLYFPRSPSNNLFIYIAIGANLRCCIPLIIESSNNSTGPFDDRSFGLCS